MPSKIYEVKDISETYGNIYEVKDISETYGGQPAYAVSHVYEGIVSVWNDIDFAYQVCEDLEYQA